METNLLRGIIAGIIIAVVYFGLSRFAFYREASKPKRLGIALVAYFIALFIFYMTWPSP